MNNSITDVVTKDSVLTVSYGKRTTNLSRTGDRGAVRKNKFYERGWSKQSSICRQIVNLKAISLKHTNNTCRELGFNPKSMNIKQDVIATLHELAYEIARGHNEVLIEWEVQWTGENGEKNKFSVTSRWITGENEKSRLVYTIEENETTNEATTTGQ